MKVLKGIGISLIAALLLFGIFNIIVFAAPLAHTVVFWLGYLFEFFAVLTLVLVLALYFVKSQKEEKFLNLPAVKMAWTYFVLQSALSVWEIIASPLPYLIALVVNLALGAIFAIIILSLYAASSRIENSEAYTAEKVIFIKQLKLKLDSIDTNDTELSKCIKALAEDVRFSDQMSHSKLASIEEALDNVIDELVENASNVEIAMALCAKAAKLLKQRNEQCKMYKGVKDAVAASAQRSGNRGGVAFIGVCVLLTLLLVTLAVCFYIVPEVKYNDAIALMDEEKYVEATDAFVDLGDYKDSEEKIEEIKIIVLDKQYDAAVILLQEKKYDEATAAFIALDGYKDSNEKIEEIKITLLDIDYNAAIALMQEEKYDEATEAFTKLGDYRDSKDKIEEIKYTLLNNQYVEAEKLFEDGKYSEAINIYTTLGDFKESKLRVEQIYNRLSEGDILYFGTYKGEPIAWKILKTEENKMLLITEEPIAEKPFHDEIKKVAWETSYLRSWLNEEFAQSFSNAQMEQIVSTPNEDTTDKIFLFSVDEMEDLVKEEKISFKTSDEWWTRTCSEDGVIYVTARGRVKAAGDQVVRDKGVRPAIWISLE